MSLAEIKGSPLAQKGISTPAVNTTSTTTAPKPATIKVGSTTFTKSSSGAISIVSPLAPVVVKAPAPKPSSSGGYVPITIKEVQPIVAPTYTTPAPSIVTTPSYVPIEVKEPQPSRYVAPAGTVAKPINTSPGGYVPIQSKPPLTGIQRDSAKYGGFNNKGYVMSTSKDVPPSQKSPLTSEQQRIVDLQRLHDIQVTARVRPLTPEEQKIYNDPTLRGTGYGYQPSNISSETMRLNQAVKENYGGASSEYGQTAISFVSPAIIGFKVAAAAYNPDLASGGKFIPSTAPRAGVNSKMDFFTGAQYYPYSKRIPGSLNVPPSANVIWRPQDNFGKQYYRDGKPVYYIGDKMYSGVNPPDLVQLQTKANQSLNPPKQSPIIESARTFLTSKPSTIIGPGINYAVNILPKIISNAISPPKPVQPKNYQQSNLSYAPTARTQAQARQPSIFEFKPATFKPVTWITPSKPTTAPKVLNYKK